MFPGIDFRKCRECWVMLTSKRRLLQNFSACAARNQASRKPENKSSLPTKSPRNNSIPPRNNHRLRRGSCPHLPAGRSPAMPKLGQYINPGNTKTQATVEPDNAQTRKAQTLRRALLAHPDEDDWAYPACGGTIPVPSFTVTNWFAVTFVRVCHSPLGQRILTSALLAWPSPKCRRKSLQDKKLD